ARAAPRGKGRGGGRPAEPELAWLRASPRLTRASAPLASDQGRQGRPWSRSRAPAGSPTNREETRDWSGPKVGAPVELGVKLLGCRHGFGLRRAIAADRGGRGSCATRCLGRGAQGRRSGAARRGSSGGGGSPPPRPAFPLPRALRPRTP